MLSIKMIFLFEFRPDHNVILRNSILIFKIISSFGTFHITLSSNWKYTWAVFELIDLKLPDQCD